MKPDNANKTKEINRKLLLSVSFVLVFICKTYSQWNLYISNDVCMDYTWNLTENQVKENVANLIAAHLDAMNATDKEPWQNKARYTCTVTNEVFFFLESKSSGTIDFNISIKKEINISKEGLYLICKFPEKALLHVETTAAVVRPYLAPKGGYLPGADTSRMVMQSYANAEYLNTGGLLLASPDAFCLNPSDTAFVIQLLGNNHNYREAIKDQNRETSFYFRFSLTPYAGNYSSVQSHTVGFLKQMPLLVTNGEIERTSPPFYISNPTLK